MSTTRLLGYFLLATSGICLIAMAFCFYKSAEPRAQQRELLASAQKINEEIESSNPRNVKGFLGIGLKGLDTTALALSAAGATASEAAALHQEKRAWQFSTLALLLGFPGVLLIRSKRQIEHKTNRVG